MVENRDRASKIVGGTLIGFSLYSVIHGDIPEAISVNQYVFYGGFLIFILVVAMGMGDEFAGELDNKGVSGSDWFVWVFVLLLAGMFCLMMYSFASSIIDRRSIVSLFLGLFIYFLSDIFSRPPKIK